MKKGSKSSLRKMIKNEVMISARITKDQKLFLNENKQINLSKLLRQSITNARKRCRK